MLLIKTIFLINNTWIVVHPSNQRADQSFSDEAYVAKQLNIPDDRITISHIRTFSTPITCNRSDNAENKSSLMTIELTLQLVHVDTVEKPVGAICIEDYIAQYGRGVVRRNPKKTVEENDASPPPIELADLVISNALCDLYPLKLPPPPFPPILNIPKKPLFNTRQYVLWIGAMAGVTYHTDLTWYQTMLFLIYTLFVLLF
jgi:hypothetical protein